MTRNYKAEYADQKRLGESGTGHDSGKAIRNRARRIETKLGMVKPGQDVDHIKPISKGGTNAKKNLRPEAPSVNRSFPRTSSGAMVKNEPKRE